MLLREGDRVSLNATVRFDETEDDHRIHLVLDGDDKLPCIIAAEHLAVLQRRFSVGDGVMMRLTNRNELGTVVAVHRMTDGSVFLWVDGSSGLHSIEAVHCSLTKPAAT